MQPTPLVAVVGTPNAGKSTLINRLSGTRTTVVHQTPGVTRDRKRVPVEWSGARFDLVDTGGFDAADAHPLAPGIRGQVLAAVEEADLVLFVVDAAAGALPGDHEMADVLRRGRVDVLLVANKVDGQSREGLAVELYELGLGDPHAVSALHGTGTGDLLDEICGRLRSRGLLAGEGDKEEEAQSTIAVAIVGRPNAGKSSLFNAIIGQDRTLVSDLPGTTRDAIDTTIENRFGRFLFVDTAGMRKAAKIEGVEYYSYLRSLQSLERAHIAVVVADATVGIGELEVTIAGEAARRHCATVVAFNKWDAARPSLEEAQGLLARKLRQRPRVLPVSALRGTGVGPLLRELADLERRYSERLPTPALNRFLADVFADRPAPQRSGRRLKAYYISQYSAAPPRFAIDVNERSLVTRDYAYYIENRLRSEYGLDGVPVIIDFKSYQGRRS